MSKSIRISEKHGVNPCIPICFFCGKEKNEVALLGRLPNDAEAPMKAVLNYEPCEECAEHMKTGIIVCVVRDGSDPENPDRTGGWFVIREEAAVAVFGIDPKQRFIFVEESAWKKVNGGGDAVDNKEE